MEIQKFLEDTAKAPIALADLTTIAASRTAHGDDVLAAFRTQIEQRSRAAQKVLDDAQAAGRDTLLASEQRDYDRHIRERDSVLSLLRGVEARTSQVAYVPPTQITNPENRADDLSPVLGREQRCADWLTRRGGYVYAGERGVESLRFGRIVRALALGDRRGLSGLESRVLSEGTDSAGGYTVPEILAGRFIDRVRNAMVVQRAGAQTVPMTSDTLHIARLAQPTAPSPDIPTATWHVENAADITETDLLLERVTFTARTLPVLLKLSVELSEDSVNVDEIIERELSQQLALELDRVALLGSGTPPEPDGIRNQSGVNIANFGGASPADYDFIVDAIGRIWANNHTPNARIYNSSLATHLAKLKDTTNQPLRAPDVVTAVPQFITNQITNSGASPDDTTMFVGDFTQLLIGLRTSFRLEVSRTAGTAFERLQVWVRAYLRADVQLAHPEAFDVTINVG
jgi:HK97 family phage major capsid protein